jgi:hypothetical protein
MVAVAPAWRKLIVWGSFCSMLLVLNTPAMLLRAWQAKQRPTYFGEPWPYWLAAATANAVVGAGGLWWLWRGVVRERRRQRARKGLCPVCAYDLTGNISGVCPECEVER